jgi:hypothetical protein
MREWGKDVNFYEQNKTQKVRCGQKRTDILYRFHYSGNDIRCGTFTAFQK